MTNLTDAVARAIWSVSYGVGPWDVQSPGTHELVKSEARAAIAEFCRYLREEMRAVNAVAGAFGKYRRGDQYYVNDYLGEATAALRAIATHLESETK